MESGDKTARGTGSDANDVEAISRREFLRMAAAALCAAAGLSAGLGSLLPGCEERRQTSNTTATIIGGDTTSSTETTTTAVPTSTTLLAGPETGRDLRIGVVSAQTGRLALSGKADAWWIGLVSDALPDGVRCGDGLVHKLRFITRDSQSDPDRAAHAAAKAILDDRVDVLLTSGSADMVNPVADRAEALVCPCLCSLVDWRRFVFGRGGTPETPFRWTYAHATGMEDIAANFIAMWDQVETNRKVGLLFPDDAGGRAWADTETGLPRVAAAAGYEVVSSPLYSAPSVDYTLFIAEFVSSGCEICCGAPGTADFILFWRQALYQGYRPKVVTMGDSLLAPHALQAAGVSARGLTAESLWQSDWPYTDSFTGMSCRELAEDYMEKTGDQWSAAIAQYSGFEWALDVFKRVASVNSRGQFIEETRRTNLRTCLGRIDFTAPLDMTDLAKSKRPAENVCKAPVGGAQWVAGETFEFEPRLVANVNNADLRVADVVRPMEYDS